jgi:hypothetical protein
MADEIFTTKEESKAYPIHPEGQFLATCVDVIDLGERVSEFAGRDKKLQRRVAFVFRTGEVDPETGKPLDIAKDFAMSMFKKSNDAQAPLRKFLEQWKGKPFADEDAAANVALHKLEGRPVVLSIGHEAWKSDPSKFNAVIVSATLPLPGTEIPPVAPYTRSDYWGKRKEKYALAAQEFRKAIGAQKPKAVSADDDDLPF